MCNYLGYSLSREQSIWVKNIEKELGPTLALEILQSGFSYGDWPVLRRNADDIEIVNMHWEFIPWWIKNGDELAAARKQGIPWLNATSERLLESKMFRDAALKRRCLVLASHFFEWRHFKPGSAKKDLAYPYCVRLKDSPYFYMAGIWQPWVDKATGETIDTFAVITTKANPLMEEIHNTKKRMPTILTGELAHEWIFGDWSEQRIKEIASYQIDAAAMEAFSIRKDFRIAEDPLEPYLFEELPSLA